MGALPLTSVGLNFWSFSVGQGTTVQQVLWCQCHAQGLEKQQCIFLYKVFKWIIFFPWTHYPAMHYAAVGIISITNVKKDQCLFVFNAGMLKKQYSTRVSVYIYIYLSLPNSKRTGRRLIFFWGGEGEWVIHDRKCHPQDCMLQMIMDCLERGCYNKTVWHP